MAALVTFKDAGEYSSFRDGISSFNAMPDPPRLAESTSVYQLQFKNRWLKSINHRNLSIKLTVKAFKLLLVTLKLTPRALNHFHCFIFKLGMAPLTCQGCHKDPVTITKCSGAEY